MKVLTSEDKKYLERVCRYLGSLGMQEGEIQIDIDDNYFNLDDKDIERVSYFDNNYSADIPEGLYPILKKIVEYSERKWNDDVDNVDYASFNIKIDCDERSISAYQNYTYTEPDDSSETEWDEKDVDDDETLYEAFIQLDEVSDGQNQIEVTYEGSGDSGYIDGQMSNSSLTPAGVEDWCYRKLESLHGGWEINEGSRGNFVFTLSPKSVTLNHTYYIQEHMSNTLWEEKF